MAKKNKQNRNKEVRCQFNKNNKQFLLNIKTIWKQKWGIKLKPFCTTYQFTITLFSTGLKYPGNLREDLTIEKYTDARRYTVWDPPAPASSRKKLPVDPTGTLFFFNCFFPVVFLDVVVTTFFLAGGIGGGWTRALPATERSRLNASSVIDISCSEIVIGLCSKDCYGI